MEAQLRGRCEFCDAAIQDEDHLIRHCPAPTFVEISFKLESDVNAPIGTDPTCSALADNLPALSEI